MDGSQRRYGVDRPYLRRHGNGLWMCTQIGHPAGHGNTWQEALHDMRVRDAQLQARLRNRDECLEIIDFGPIPRATLWQRLCSWFGERQ